jgi:hypothetical protein
MRKLPPFARPALVIASVGVLAQVIILWHALVHTYPFKMMTYPPWRFYQQVGYFGGVGVLLCTAGLALLFARKAPLLLPILLTTAAPLLYVLGVVLATGAAYGWTVPPHTRNFDGYEVVQATREFTETARHLAIVGCLVGGFCSLVLWVAKRSHSKSSTA